MTFGKKIEKNVSKCQNADTRSDTTLFYDNK